MSCDTGEDAKRRDAAATVELAGIAASRGVYRGRARVVTAPADFGRLVPGDVPSPHDHTPTRSAAPGPLGHRVWHKVGAQSAIVDSAIAGERPREAGLSREGSSRA